MIYKNNWIAWCYDKIEYGRKTSPNSEFDLKIKPTIELPVKSYKEESLLNAQQIRDSINGPLDILLSGGVDSEVMLRCFVELKIPVNVFIFCYENNYNAFDVTNAKKLCAELNITPTVIDFNLEKFFETDAYDIWTKCHCLNSGRLPHMKMLDYLDNTVIMGDGDFDWERKDNQWLLVIREIDFSQSVYATAVNRPVVQWYSYSPEITLSIFYDPVMNSMHESYNVVKYFLNKSHWPAVQIRPKAVGYEGNKPLGLPMSKPDFMLEFNKKYIPSGFPSYYFTEQEMLNQLVRHE